MPIKSHVLFEEPGGLVTAKVKLNEKQNPMVIAQHIDLSFLPFTWEMTVSALLDFIFSISFGLPFPIDYWTFQGVNLVLPDLTQYLQSLNIQLPTVSTQTINIPSFNIVIPQAQWYFNETVITQCVYGESLFDYCYYDPGFEMQNVRAYLKSSINRISRNMAIEPTLTAVDVDDGLAIWANTMLNAIMQTMQKNVILDVSLLDLTQFAPESEENPNETILDYVYLTVNTQLNGKSATPRLSILDDVLWGCTLDWTPLDACRFAVPNQTIVSDLFARYVSLIGEAVKSNYSPLQTAVKSSFIDPSLPTLPLTPTLTQLFESAFPQLIENAQYAPLTAPAERWYAGMSIEKMVSKAVKNMLSGMGIDQFTMRQYVNAMLEYCFAFHHRRVRKRYDTYANIPIDAFQKWWLAKWSHFGLSINILNQLLNTIGSVCQAKWPGQKQVQAPQP